MIYVLDAMQKIFGKLYPLFFSAIFAALSIYYTEYESPDKVALVTLSGISSFAWLCLFGAEEIMGRLVIALEGTTDILESILAKQPKE